MVTLASLVTLSLLSSQIDSLPEQDLAAYDSQVPALAVTAKQHIQSTGAPIRVSNALLLAPIVHSFYFDFPQDVAGPPLWKTNHDFGSRHDAKAKWKALQFTVDWTNEYTLEGLRARGFAASGPKEAVAANAGLATAGKDVKGTKVWRNTQPGPRGVISGTGFTYGASELKDWSSLSVNGFRAIPNFGASIYVNSSAKWEYAGHARVNNEAILSFKVHHWLEVTACTNDNWADCRTARIPLNENDDVVSSLFIPAMAALDEKRMEEHHLRAIRTAARHSAELILTAFDAVVVNAGAAAAAVGVPPVALVSELHGKCVDVPGGKFEAGPLIMWDCRPGAANQAFRLAPQGQITIGGLCVDAYGGRGNAGDTIGLYACTAEAPNQKWQWADGLLKGINGRCISISGADPKNGAPLILWDCTGTADQKWQRRQ